MAGRGPQSFQKRQKEQQRKEKQQEKLARKVERRRLGPNETEDDFATLDEDGNMIIRARVVTEPAVGEQSSEQPS